jgi:hypothetical protein
VGGSHGTNGGKRNVYRLLVGKPDGKTTRKTKPWVVDTIKMDLVEVGWDGVDWILLAQDKDKWKTLENVTVTLRVL